MRLPEPSPSSIVPMPGPIRAANPHSHARVRTIAEPSLNMKASSFVGFVAHVQRNHCTLFRHTMETADFDLARQVDAAQSILVGEPAREARRLEAALAQSSRAVVEALARM